ncbi:MAG: DUF5615 family PIN-like protein [Limisphaerales bacterium]
MPEQPLHLVLDQNIPREVAGWLRGKFPDWKITHVTEVKLDGRPDSEIFLWAQKYQAVVVTYDEDFAGARLFPLGTHHGVIRLRVWPTTVEMTQWAIDRLFAQVPENDLRGSLAIVEREKIRLRRKP